MAVYEFALLVTSAAILGAVVLPRLLADKPMSFPLIYVVAGYVVFTLPLGFPAPNPIENPGIAEHLTELVVIVALMGAGLKLDRPFDWRAWMSAWRLLGITMPLTIAAIATLGWAALGLHPATAVLLGAVVAPTDPVLASTVEATPLTADVDEEVDLTNQEGAIRFALTSEAGLDDGLAFPFTFLAVVMAGATLATSPEPWLSQWFVSTSATRSSSTSLRGWSSATLSRRRCSGGSRPRNWRGSWRARRRSAEPCSPTL